MTASIRAPLCALEAALPPPAPAGPSAALEPARNSDAGVLAEELAAAFGQLVEGYREHYGLTPAEAVARAQAPAADDRPRPPSQVSWHDLNRLSRADPARALAAWEDVKRAAREEVATGHRAAKAVEGHEGTCWNRAQYLAVRDDLARAWRPRGGPEWALVEQMAQAQVLLWRWQARLVVQAEMTAWQARLEEREGRGHPPPRVSEAQAEDHCMRMVERWQRFYLRAQEALLRPRRRGSPVVVRRAGQVNLAQNQVNVVMGGPAPPPRGRGGCVSAPAR